MFFTFIQYWTKRARFAAPLIVAMFMSGCFEFDQTLYINLDGTGRAEMKFALPLDMMNLMKIDVGESGIPLNKSQLETQFGSREGIELLGGTFREEGNLKIVNVLLKFDDVSYLGERGLIYEWTVDHDERIFRLVVDRRPQRQKMNQIHAALIKGMTDSGARITVHLPRRISNTNADKYDGNTARWFLPAGWLLNPNAKPKTMEARFKITRMERFKSWFEGVF